MDSTGGAPAASEGRTSDSPDETVTTCLMAFIDAVRDAVSTSSMPIMKAVHSGDRVSSDFYATIDAIQAAGANITDAERAELQLLQQGIDIMSVGVKKLLKVYRQAADTIIEAASKASSDAIVEKLPGNDVLEILCAVAYTGDVVAVNGSLGDGGIDVHVPAKNHVIQCKLGLSYRSKTRVNLHALIGAALSSSFEGVTKATLVQTSFTPQDEVIKNIKARTGLDVDMKTIEGVVTYLCDQMQINDGDDAFQDARNVYKTAIGALKNALETAQDGLPKVAREPAAECVKLLDKALSNLETFLVEFQERLDEIQGCKFDAYKAKETAQQEYEDDDTMSAGEKLFMAGYYKDDDGADDED